MKKHLPNFVTLLNLLCGVVALLMISRGNENVAVILVMVAALLDFLDGFLARILKAGSEVGKQLDSLADMVTFGLVPAFFIYRILGSQLEQQQEGSICGMPWVSCLMLGSILLIPAFSAIRLARFNVSEGSDYFSGLPTPAHALFWTGIYFEINSTGTLYGQHVYVWFIWTVMIMFAVLLIAPLPMLALKFRNFAFRNNAARYLLIGFAVLMLIFFQLSGLPLVVLTYILLSLFRFLIT